MYKDYYEKCSVIEKHITENITIPLLNEIYEKSFKKENILEPINIVIDKTRKF